MLTKMYPANPLWECSVQNLYLYTRYAFQNNVTSVAFLQIWRKDYFGAILVKRNIPVFALTEYFSGQNDRLLNMDISHSGLPICQDTQWICRAREPAFVCVQPFQCHGAFLWLIAWYWPKKKHQTNKNEKRKKRKENNNKKQLDYKSKRILIFLI